jgi:methionyl-tRNA formyltransferase
VTAATRTAVVFGKGRVAVKAAELLVDEGYDLKFIVPSVELASDTTFSDWAVSSAVELRRVDRLDDLGDFHADLGISAYYDQIFRQRHIDAFDMLLNVHNSLLPRYRGVRPVNWSRGLPAHHHGGNRRGSCARPRGLSS